MIGILSFLVSHIIQHIFSNSRMHIIRYFPIGFGLVLSHNNTLEVILYFKPNLWFYRLINFTYKRSFKNEFLFYVLLIVMDDNENS